MKIHEFTFNVPAFALESYLTVEKYKDLKEHNQFDKIKAHYDLIRFKNMYKEFTNTDLLTEITESKEV